MPAFIKMGIGTQGFGGPKPRLKRNMERFCGRREVKPGFPRIEPFSTMQEVGDYLSQDTITCLLCGREMQKVDQNHLGRIHGTTVEKYKIQFNIPLRYGLVSIKAADNYSKAATSLKRLAHITALAREWQPSAARAVHENGQVLNPVQKQARGQRLNRKPRIKPMCTVPGCGRVNKANGLCDKHYQRQRAGPGEFIDSRGRHRRRKGVNE